MAVSKGFKIIVIAFVSVLLSSPVAYGQSDFSVGGTVVDAQTGQTLPGVNVSVLGNTGIGDVTDTEGTFSLEVPSAQDTLVFSFIGYEEQQVPIGGRSELRVRLNQATVEAEEVVVVGYTPQRSRTVTGAVSSVSSEELADRKLGTLEEALKGRIPGVRVETTGDPGAGASVTIRGPSFTGSSSPLYVVDGVYTGTNPNLNPDDIASVEVLKDASATAQYGSQAANGVIVITTKKGSQGPAPDVSVGAYYGSQDVPTRIDMMNAQEWAELAREAHENAGLAPPPNVANPGDYANTDWQDALFKRGAIQNYNVSVSGGNENASYLISGEYFDQEGTIIGTPYQRYSARVNSEISRGIFTFGETATFVRSTKEILTGAPLIQSVQQIPTIPVRDESTVGGFGIGNGSNESLTINPVAEQRLNDDVNYYNRLLGSLYGEVDIFDNLNYRLNLGLEYTSLKNEHFREQGRLRMNDPLDPAFYEVTNDDTYDLQVENLLNFDDTFGNHALNGVLGYREERIHTENLYAYREGYSDEDLRQIAAGSAEGAQTGGNETTATRRSFLARANYEYDGRYLATGTFRRDGSSRFGAGNRYGNFFSGSVGWVLSEESFYEAIPFFNSNVNLFKLRASYGEVGNENIDPYAQYAGIALNQGYTLGPNERLAPGAIQLALANENIRWQENRQFNVGLDLELFQGALSLSSNYYISTSDDLLVQAPLPPSLGATGTPYVNAGSIRNRGFELGLDYRYSRGDFQFNTNANLSTIQNEVLELGLGNQPIFAGPFNVSRTAVGGPVGVLYVLETDGIFQSEEEVQDHTSMVDGEEVLIQPNAEPGDVRFVDRVTVDTDGDGEADARDGVISDEDRYNAGSSYPDLEGGLSFDAGYKSFDLSLSLRGSYGAELFNVPRYWNAVGNNSNYRAGVDPWTPEDPNTDTPRAVWGTGPSAVSNNRANSDRWIEDASYLRIQSLELGYTLPGSLFQNLAGASNASLRFYVNTQNLYTFTGYSNWDPATPGQGTLAPAVDDLAIYPASRTFTFGVDLDL